MCVRYTKAHGARHQLSILNLLRDNRRMNVEKRLQRSSCPWIWSSDWFRVKLFSRCEAVLFRAQRLAAKLGEMKRLALLIYTCRTFIFRVPSRSQAPDWLMTILYNQYADRIGRGARSAMTAKWRPEKGWRCQIMTAQDQSYVVWSRSQ